MLLLPSPLLGAGVYEPVRAALARAGLSASVAPAEPDALRLIASWTELAAAYDEVVLVPHSNAGYLAPAVSAAVGGAPIVFVDAALPGAEPVTRLAPEAFRSFLAGLADEDGLLPPWTRWWPREECRQVLPGRLFGEVDRAVPRVPLAYVDAEVAVPPGWEVGRRGYLAFGATYDEEWHLAGRLGWPRRRLADAGHLHLLVAPDEVAGVVSDLVGRLIGRR